MAPKTQRVHGEAFVSLSRFGLSDLRQQGSAKAMLPRTDAPEPEVVFLNTAGGVTDGDKLRYGLQIGRDMRATAATQTAERAYRALGDTPGQIATRISVGDGAHLDWLPQDLIAFDGCNIRRDTQIDLAPSASVLMVDSLVLGRAAHGETVSDARIEDIRTVRRDGRLVHQEHLLLTRDTLSDMQAIGGNRAFATLALIGRNAADRIGPLRDVLGPNGHATAIGPDRLVARLASDQAAPLRRVLIRAILCLRGRPVPRVWQSDV